MNDEWLLKDVPACLAVIIIRDEFLSQICKILIAFLPFFFREMKMEEERIEAEKKRVMKLLMFIPFP